MNLGDMEYYVTQLITLNSTVSTEEQKQYAQRRIDRFIEHEQKQKEVRDQYYTLQNQINELLADHPELKELE